MQSFSALNRERISPRRKLFSSSLDYLNTFLYIYQIYKWKVFIECKPTDGPTHLQLMIVPLHDSCYQPGRFNPRFFQAQRNLFIPLVAWSNHSTFFFFPFFLSIRPKRKKSPRETTLLEISNPTLPPPAIFSKNSDESGRCNPSSITNPPKFQPPPSIPHLPTTPRRTHLFAYTTRTKFPLARLPGG